MPRVNVLRHAVVGALLALRDFSRPRCSPASRSAPTELRIGEIDSLSGVLAAQGTAVHEGVVYAVPEVNRRGGIHGHPVKLITRDDGGRPDEATNAAHDLAVAREGQRAGGRLRRQHRRPGGAGGRAGARPVCRELLARSAADAARERLVLQDQPAGAVRGGHDGRPSRAPARRETWRSSFRRRRARRSSPGSRRSGSRPAGVTGHRVRELPDGDSRFHPSSRAREGRAARSSCSWTGSSRTTSFSSGRSTASPARPCRSSAPSGWSFPPSSQQLGPLGEGAMGAIVWEPGMSLSGDLEGSRAYETGFAREFGHPPAPLSMYGYTATRAVLAALEKASRTPGSSGTGRRSRRASRDRPPASPRASEVRRARGPAASTRSASSRSRADGTSFSILARRPPES